MLLVVSDNPQVPETKMLDEGSIYVQYLYMCICVAEIYTLTAVLTVSESPIMTVDFPLLVILLVFALSILC